MESRARSVTASSAAPDAEEIAVVGYPSLRGAARLLGVSPSTLSRRGDLRRVSAGREERIPAEEVVRLAGEYQRRPVSEVAGELVERAAPAGSDVQGIVAHEVDSALERVAAAAPVSEAALFIADAHRHLPKELAEQVEAYVTAEGPRGRSTVGWTPETD